MWFGEFDERYYVNVSEIINHNTQPVKRLTLSGKIKQIIKEKFKWE